MSTESTTPAPQSQPSATPAAPAAEARPSQDPGLDSRLASLAKREREIQQQLSQLKQEKQNLVPKNELADLWKSNRGKLRELLGASPDELPDLKQESEDPIKSMKQEIEDMKREKQQKEQQEAINTVKGQISSITSQDKDAYELINAFDANEMVFDLVLDHYREHQEELDYREAANQVEKYLEDQIKRASSTKKIGSLFQPKETQVKETSPTLTGSMVSSPIGTASRRLTEDESKAEAAKLIKWI
jgi:hypothetical protein